MKVDKTKLTFIGCMNYTVQVFRNKNTATCTVSQYQPRRNKVWTHEVEEDEAVASISETIERMKICISQMQEFLDGKRDSVYYWD